MENLTRDSNLEKASDRFDALDFLTRSWNALDASTASSFGPIKRAFHCSQIYPLARATRSAARRSWSSRSNRSGEELEASFGIQTKGKKLLLLNTIDLSEASIVRWFWTVPLFDRTVNWFSIPAVDLNWYFPFEFWTFIPATFCLIYDFTSFLAVDDCHFVHRDLQCGVFISSTFKLVD